MLPVLYDRVTQCPNLMNFSRVSNPQKNRIQLSAGLNLKKLNTILNGPNKFKPRLKFFKFGLGLHCTTIKLIYEIWSFNALSNL